MATTQLMTADDLEQMAPEELRIELMRGELRRMAPTGLRHGMVANEINVPMAIHAKANDLGTVIIDDPGFVLGRNPDTVLAPDVAFIRKDRMPPKDMRDRFANIAPDLVVEVVSPSDRPAQIDDKIAAYLAAGVRLLWAAYPSRRTVRVHRPGRPVLELGEDDALDGEDVLPGFRLPLRDIFR